MELERRTVVEVRPPHTSACDDHGHGKRQSQLRQLDPRQWLLDCMWIVTQLRAVKRHRQVIVVTHNANLVVNGNAELVVGLEAWGGQSHMECEGSLQAKRVRDTVCAVMEGGEKAFRQRYHRIIEPGTYSVR